MQEQCSAERPIRLFLDLSHACTGESRGEAEGGDWGGGAEGRGAARMLSKRKVPPPLWQCSTAVLRTANVHQLTCAALCDTVAFPSR